MKNMILFVVMFLTACSHVPAESASSPQLDVVKNMIAAVNNKDAEQYAQGFSKNIEIYVEDVLRVDGREALIKNRTNHFKQHPNVRSEIQHLVEIDNRVIMHDKVWLEPKAAARDIVEVFTFENGEVVRMDVIQPRNLFSE